MGTLEYAGIGYEITVINLKREGTKIPYPSPLIKE
jgi:hypothetical protein